MNGAEVFFKTRPQYETYAIDGTHLCGNIIRLRLISFLEFVSVKSNGAKGDGSTDDTAAIQAVFDEYAGCKIICECAGFVNLPGPLINKPFSDFDAGSYVVQDTINIPAGSVVTGEFWSTILASGPKFADINNPVPVFKVYTSSVTFYNHSDRPC
jgi:glucan 1,3-beta-glucosidase